MADLDYPVWRNGHATSGYRSRVLATPDGRDRGRPDSLSGIPADRADASQVQPDTEQPGQSEGLVGFLPDEEKKKSNNIFYLVEHTEQILATEQSGWVREMQSTMQRQRERESELFSNAPNLVPDSKGNGAGQTVKGPATDEQSAPENN